jgi:hypothetical protein
VAKRAFAREHKAQTAAKLADWAFEPLGTAASNLHNIGDEEGINIRLEWRAGATGRLEESPFDRIDPGDSRRISAGPLTQQRRVIVTWDRPDGTTKSVVREFRGSDTSSRPRRAQRCVLQIIGCLVVRRLHGSSEPVVVDGSAHHQQASGEKPVAQISAAVRRWANVSPARVPGACARSCGSTVTLREPKSKRGCDLRIRPQRRRHATAKPRLLQCSAEGRRLPRDFRGGHAIDHGKPVHDERPPVNPTRG